MVTSIAEHNNYWDHDKHIKKITLYLSEMKHHWIIFEKCIKKLTMLTFCNWTNQVPLKTFPIHHFSYQHSDILVSITQVWGWRHHPTLCLIFNYKILSHVFSTHHLQKSIEQKLKCKILSHVLSTHTLLKSNEQKLYC